MQTKNCPFSKLFYLLYIFAFVFLSSPTLALANFAYVTNAGNGTVSVIDTSTNQVVGAPITVDTAPSAIAITPNGNFAYVTNNGSNSVSVIDTSTNSVVETITGLNAPFGIAITPIPPPENLTGVQKKNNFGLVYELVNFLKWGPSLSSSVDVAGYYVYRDGIKIATLNAATCHYADHKREKGITTVYTVTAFDANGNTNSSTVEIN